MSDSKKARAEARRQRTLAIQTLRETGMTDNEIEAELGYDPNTVLPRRFRKPKVFTVDDDGIIDAEIVDENDLSNDQVMERAPSHLPAVISNEPEEPTTHKKRDWSKSAVPERQCIRIKRNGDRCGNSAIKGATVCRYHGGAAKHVKQAARARIENATDRLAKELLGMAVDPNMTPQVKLAAIRDALDRGGLKPPATVEVGPAGVFEEVFSDIVTGSRADYRESIGIIDDSPLDQPTYMPERREYVDTEQQPPPPPRYTPEQRRPRDYYSTGHVTGDDAIRLANQANGLTRDDDISIVDVLNESLPPRRALPPGRFNR